MNSTSVSGQSQPSLSRSQAHIALISPFWNFTSISLRSDDFILPLTAAAVTPRSLIISAICSACFTLAQNMTVRLPLTYSMNVSTISVLRSGTNILLSRSRILYCTLLNRTFVRSILVCMRIQRTGTSSPISTAVCISSLCAVFLNISMISLSSARSGVAVSPNVNFGLKYARTF